MLARRPDGSVVAVSEGRDDGDQSVVVALLMTLDGQKTRLSARGSRVRRRSGGPGRRLGITEFPASLGSIRGTRRVVGRGSGRVLSRAVLLAVAAIALVSAPAQAFDCGGTAGPARVG